MTKLILAAAFGLIMFHVVYIIGYEAGSTAGFTLGYCTNNPNPIPGTCQPRNDLIR